MISTSTGPSAVQTKHTRNWSLVAWRRPQVTQIAGGVEVAQFFSAPPGQISRKAFATFAIEDGLSGPVPEVSDHTRCRSLNDRAVKVSVSINDTGPIAVVSVKQLIVRGSAETASHSRRGAASSTTKGSAAPQGPTSMAAHFLTSMPSSGVSASRLGRQNSNLGTAESKSALSPYISM